MPELLAVCVVHELHDDAGTVGTTAIDKRPQQHAVKIGPYGARGDVQADRKDHGGLEAALYAYADEDAVWWAARLLERLGERAPDELEPGWFGENLRLAGIDVSGARIGERWRIGSGEHAVEVEVMSPRRPCQTFARWVAHQYGVRPGARLGQGVPGGRAAGSVPARGAHRQHPGGGCGRDRVAARGCADHRRGLPRRRSRARDPGVSR